MASKATAETVMGAAVKETLHVPVAALDGIITSFLLGKSGCYSLFSKQLI
jgi:hypothetical protein